MSECKHSITIIMLRSMDDKKKIINIYVKIIKMNVGILNS